MQHLWAERRLAEQSQRPNDHRSPWQRDRARILHSAAFRRLQAKTQIMGIGQNDFYRTRLTHSLEAAQIGTALVAQLSYQQEDPLLRALLAQDSLMEALCLAHDLGHPPYAIVNDKRMFATMI
jgi:dGTPase